MRKLFFFIFTFSACITQIKAQDRISKEAWIQQVMSRMSPEDKIAQLFVIRSKSDTNEADINFTKNLLTRYAIGGVCFFQGKPRRQVELTNEFQRIARIPLMISMDAEWGTGMRLKNDGFSYPKNMTLGAIQDNQLIYQTGVEIGQQLKRLGVHLNYAPVVDINLNPNNPVINERSFGSNKNEVTAKAFAMMNGMQDAGVLACLKHFPGHGDTDIDSHLDLPIIAHDRQRIENVETYPYRILTRYQPASIMVGHLHIPSLDTSRNLPATLSPIIVNSLIRDSFNYDGLIITDALEMKAVAKNYPNGELEKLAFLAGNDILLLSENVEKSIQYLLEALQRDEISIAALDEKVIRILRAKYQCGLDQRSVINTDNIEVDLKKKEFNISKEKLYRAAVTLIRDESNDVPIRNLNQKIISISINQDKSNTFQDRLQNYKKSERYYYNTNQLPSNKDIKNFESKDLVFISLHKLNFKKDQNFGISNATIDWINELSMKTKVVLVIFGNPYLANQFSNVKSIILAYEDNSLMQDVTAQLVFGAGAIIGKSPMDIGINYQKQITRPSLLRLGYAPAETVGMNSNFIFQIDSLAMQMIHNRTTPGCQILVAKDGKIVMSKEYGYLRYDSIDAVTPTTLYDIASLTKIAATVPSLMILQDQNKFDLKKKFSNYFEAFVTSNKADATFKDFLLHQARFVSWIPFYKSTLISPDTLNIINWSYYRKQRSDSFNIQVTDSLFLRTDMRDSVFQKIINSKRHEEKKFWYSDIGFYFMPALVEKLSGLNFENFLIKNIINPLGLDYFCYNPIDKNIPKNQIAPSEEDEYFRHQEIQGYVHDMGAAMLGGISGHAGIFANAESIAKLMQCYLNRGNYGGQELISSNVILVYTDRDSELMRRGIGFDLKEIDPKDPPYVSSLASNKVYGHQGFTGTCVWVDPRYNLIYVFLSNRTYPKSSINNLHKYRYRTKIQDIIYKSIQ